MYSLVPWQLFKDYRGHKVDKDQYLIEMFLSQASDDIQEYCHREFLPEYKTVYYDHPEDPTQLRFGNEDLLEISTLKTDNGATTISSDDYFLKWADDYQGPPYDRVVLNPYGSQLLLSYVDTPFKANLVTGTWGFHENWAKAWRATGDTVQDDPLSSSSTTLTVTEADGLWPNGQSNRFSSLQVLKIGTEYLYVEAVNTATDKLTVERGILGTTAAEHAQGTAIYAYQVMRPIERLTVRLADWYYSQKDTKDDTADRPIITASGATIMPQDLPRDVVRGLRKYRRVYVDSGLKKKVVTRYPF